MKTLLLTALFAATAHAEYLSESPLPVGWPAPGPFQQVVEKAYPTTRLAVTEKKGFMTLFRHIKSKDIPMTAPVVRTMNIDKLKEEDMQFLYQDTEVGTTGAASKYVEIKDVPKIKALTYAWIGKGGKKNETIAKEALLTALKNKGLENKVQEWRLFSYNSPFKHPKDKHCHELQAVLKP